MQHGPISDCTAALLSLPLAATVGLIALLRKYRRKSPQRFLARMGLLLFVACWVWTFWESEFRWRLIRLWFGFRPEERQVYDVHFSPVALLFLPTMALLLMMLAESDAESATGDSPGKN
jgi:hypothetical protein